MRAERGSDILFEVYRVLRWYSNMGEEERVWIFEQRVCLDGFCV